MVPSAEESIAPRQRLHHLLFLGTLHPQSLYTQALIDNGIQLFSFGLAICATFGMCKVNLRSYGTWVTQLNSQLSLEAVPVNTQRT